MSATITMTTALQPLCLLPVSTAASDTKQKTAAQPANTLEASEQRAVNMLADKLYACNLEPTKSSVSSKLVFDKDALCDDGPYVHLSMEAANSPVKTPLSSGKQQPTHSLNSSSSLLHMQPVSNPFKTMMRAEPNTAPITSFPHTPWQPKQSGRLCVHCKRGNFLEFCFSMDRCSCVCHNECPCKPCLDIRKSRSRKMVAREMPRRLSPLDGLSADVCDRPLATAPITRYRSQG